jgi:hypothetical protein
MVVSELGSFEKHIEREQTSYQITRYITPPNPELLTQLSPSFFAFPADELQK